MDWHRIGFWLEDMMSRWWWAYIIFGTIVLPLVLHAMGFGGGSSDECYRYGTLADSC